MSDMFQLPRIHVPHTGPAPGGLTVRQIVLQVVDGHAGMSVQREVDLVVETVDACVRLGARREVVSAGLGTQETLDRLAQIATGRARAGRLERGECAAMESLCADMHTRLSHILADWQKAGERFTRLTRLLPAQLGNQWPALPALDTAHRHTFEHVVEPTLRSEFERARIRCVAAQRRCARATHEVERGRMELRQAETAFRGGQCSVLSLAQSVAQLQRQVESKWQAEAERLVPQHVMEWLARPELAVVHG